MIVLLSYKKELLCEGCIGSNKISIAAKRMWSSLLNSILPDGSKPSDPTGAQVHSSRKRLQILLLYYRKKSAK